MMNDMNDSKQAYIDSDNHAADTARVNMLWLVLMLLTLFSAYMAEHDVTSLVSVSIMAVVLAIKGRIIVDYFMELKNANTGLRFLMRLYFVVIPVLIILVYLFPVQIASWTALS
jgi:cytochrome c oxidase subunit IV